MTLTSSRAPVGLATERVTRLVRATIARHGLLVAGDVLVLGVSGGPDSLCMLDLLRALAPEYGVSLHVGHLHHGIRGADADEDARYVEALCLEWGAPCTVERADVPALARARQLSLEEAARQARYSFLARVARVVGGRSVAVAHNADDQVETVLMHLLRGAGMAGLRGMQPLSCLDELRLGGRGVLSSDTGDAVTGRLRLLRPLLDVTRSDVEAYCREQGLQPCEDASNLDRTYYRNRLRHELIPLLETYNPAVRQVLRRTAQVLAGEYELLRAQLEAVWLAVVRAETKEAIVYDLAALRAQPVGLQRSLVREGVQHLRRSLRDVSWVHVEEALQVVAGGQTGAAATLPAGLELRLCYADAVLAAHDYVAPSQDAPRVGAEALTLPVPGSLLLPDGRWRISAQLLARGALPAGWEHNADRYLAWLDADLLSAPLALRARRDGDWLCPLGLERHQKLHDLMINLKIPRAERDGVPLLVSGNDVAWVVGYRLDARFTVRAGTQRVLVLRVEDAGSTA